MRHAYLKSKDPKQAAKRTRRLSRKLEWSKSRRAAIDAALSKPTD
jgi:hypothetical protein